MNVHLIAEIAGLAIAGVGGWFWRSKLEIGLLEVAEWSIRTSEFWGLLETFLNEAAVLWFVFPVLDGLYDRAEGKAPPTVKAIIGSFGISFASFVAALYSKKREFRLKEKEKLEKGE